MLRAIVISGAMKNGCAIYYTLSESWQFSAQQILVRVRDIMARNPESYIKISVR